VVGLALAAILASAVLHAGWNALLKRSPDPTAASVILVALAAVTSGGVGVIVGVTAVPWSAWPLLLATGLIEGIYFVTLTRALELLPLGSAYGISRGLGLLLIWPFSAFWFAEGLDGPVLAGAGLLSLGLFSLITGVTSRRGLVMAIACAATITAYPLAYKGALVAGVDPFPLFSISLALALPFQWLSLGRRGGERLRAAWTAQPGRLLFSALICAASFILFLVALKLAGAGRVTALRNTSVLVASMLGWAFGELPTRRSVLAAVSITLGAVLVAH
jgi:drug/metabolite transporter (DMT)-like permease